MRTAQLLTAVKLKALPEGKASAVGGVRGLTVCRQNGHLRFYLRFTSPLTKKQREYAIGVDIDLKTARSIATPIREAIDAGRDPVEERKLQNIEAKAQAEEAAAPTVRQCALKWITSKESAWSAKNQRRANDARLRFDRHVFPHIGDLKVKDVTPEQAFKCVEQLLNETPSEATKVIGLLNQFFRWAINEEIRDDGVNPTSKDGKFGALLENKDDGLDKSTHQAALPYKQAPEFYALLTKSEATSARILRFIMLTAARSKAARLATWDQFDLDAGIWTIPVANDKSKATGITKAPLRDIVLSPTAIAFLKSLPSYSEGSKPDRWVFESSMGRPVTAEALIGALKKLHEKKKAIDGIGWIEPDKSKVEKGRERITAHGFRSTFRTWADEDEHGNTRRFNQTAVEYCLLHNENSKTVRAYRRNFLTNERRAVLTAWGRYLTTGKWPDEE